MNWLHRVIAFLRPPEVAKSEMAVEKAIKFRSDLRELRRFELVVRRR